MSALFLSCWLGSVYGVFGLCFFLHWWDVKHGIKS